jgi:hypothetical protein
MHVRYLMYLGALLPTVTDTYGTRTDQTVQQYRIHCLYTAAPMWVPLPYRTISMRFLATIIIEYRYVGNTVRIMHLLILPVDTHTNIDDTYTLGIETVKFIIIEHHILLHFQYK